jgi:hypothetical protein
LRQACPRRDVFTAIGYQYVKIEKQHQTVIACFAARGYKSWDDAPAIVRSLGTEIMRAPYVALNRTSKRALTHSSREHEK